MFIILFFLMILLSAFYSSSELAFSAVDRIKLRMLAHNGDKRSIITLKYLSHPDKFLIPILVGNSYANVLYAQSSLKINEGTFSCYFTEFELVFYGTLILLIFAEIIPKVVAKRFTDGYLRLVLYPFLVFDYLIKPVSIGVSIAGRVIVKLFNIPMDSGKELLTRDDIHNIVDEVNESNGESNAQLEILSKLIRLNDYKVKELMTHRSSISGVNINGSIYELKRLFKTTFYSRFIVYENNYDNIVGIVYSNDMLSSPTSIKDVMREPYYIPSNMNVLTLFRIFQKEKISIAVIIDEFGGCEGIITMHDIIEELVGRSEDMYSRNRFRGISYRKQRNLLIVNGNVELEDVEKAIEHFSPVKNFSFDEMNYETLNGYIINSIGYIPIRGEMFDFNGVNFRIIKAKRNLINTVVIDLNKIVDGNE